MERLTDQRLKEIVEAHRREEGETFDDGYRNGPWCLGLDHDAPPVEWPCEPYQMASELLEKRRELEWLEGK